MPMRQIAEGHASQAVQEHGHVSEAAKLAPVILNTKTPGNVAGFGCSEAEEEVRPGSNPGFPLWSEVPFARGRAVDPVPDDFIGAGGHFHGIKKAAISAMTCDKAAPESDKGQRATRSKVLHGPESYNDRCADSPLHHCRLNLLATSIRIGIAQTEDSRTRHHTLRIRSGPLREWLDAVRAAGAVFFHSAPRIDV